MTEIKIVNKKRKSRRTRFINGLKGEKKFVQLFTEGKLRNYIPEGILHNCTKIKGCGYDFKIMSGGNKIFFIEVKSCSQKNGTVWITENEWRSAREKGKNYFLIILKNLNGKTFFRIINNPYNKENFTPAEVVTKKYVLKTVNLENRVLV